MIIVVASNPSLPEFSPSRPRLAFFETRVFQPECQVGAVSLKKKSLSRNPEAVEEHKMLKVG